MRLRRFLCSLVFAGLCTAVASAQTVDLREENLVGSCYSISLALEMKGKITVQQGGQAKSFARTAQAKHAYLERLLDAKDGMADRAARQYRVANVTLAEEKESVKMSLRPRRTLAVAQRIKGLVAVYSPDGPLLHDELAVTEHFDTLAVPALVANKAVTTGDSWKVSNAGIQAMCAIDGLEDKSEITCRVENIDEANVEVSFLGSVQGIEKGGQVSLLVQGKYQFDRAKKRVVSLEWKQTDQRTQGPTNPSMSSDIVIRLTRTPIAEPSELGDLVLARVGTGLPDESLLQALVEDETPTCKLEVGVHRDWSLVSQQTGQIVLRLVDRGDFVAQCTITRWAQYAKGSTIDQFAKAMSEAYGWKQEKEVGQAETLKSEHGYTIYRISGQGKLNGVEAVQSFYLVAHPQGEHRLVTFTMLPIHLGKLDSRDQTLVRSLRLQPTAAGVSGN